MGPVGIGLTAASTAIREAQDAGYDMKDVRLSAMVLVAAISIADGTDNETLVTEFRFALERARSGSFPRN
jgi:hypothetical protein